MDNDIFFQNNKVTEKKTNAWKFLEIQILMNINDIIYLYIYIYRLSQKTDKLFGIFLGKTLNMEIPVFSS